jgi:hypothetical protein
MISIHNINSNPIKGIFSIRFSLRAFILQQDLAQFIDYRIQCCWFFLIRFEWDDFLDRDLAEIKDRFCFSQIILSFVYVQFKWFESIFRLYFRFF